MSDTAWAIGLTLSLMYPVAMVAVVGQHQRREFTDWAVVAAQILLTWSGLALHAVGAGVWVAVVAIAVAALLPAATAGRP